MPFDITPTPASVWPVGKQYLRREPLEQAHARFKDRLKHFPAAQNASGLYLETINVDLLHRPAAIFPLRNLAIVSMPVSFLRFAADPRARRGGDVRQ
jgi:hypothetical protein